MPDEHPHPLLAQVPLTLSPFLSLPTAVPLPYSYKNLPSTLPPSILSASPPQPSSTSTAAEEPHSHPYIVSSSGKTATPDSILTSCIALQRHLEQLEAEARQTLKDWVERCRAEDLAEKRRLAPGWLDNDVHILKPDNETETDGGLQQNHQQQQQKQKRQQMGTQQDLMEIGDAQPPQAEQRRNEGEELDRVFGGLSM